MESQEQRIWMKEPKESERQKRDRKDILASMDLNAQLRLLCSSIRKASDELGSRASAQPPLRI